MTVSLVLIVRNTSTLHQHTALFMSENRNTHLASNCTAFFPVASLGTRHQQRFRHYSDLSLLDQADAGSTRQRGRRRPLLPQKVPLGLPLLRSPVLARTYLGLPQGRRRSRCCRVAIVFVIVFAIAIVLVAAVSTGLAVAAIAVTTLAAAGSVMTVFLDGIAILHRGGESGWRRGGWAAVFDILRRRTRSSGKKHRH